eukprot:1645822-Alexandrium_andersonii.AAC.1
MEDAPVTLSQEELDQGRQEELSQPDSFSVFESFPQDELPDDAEIYDTRWVDRRKADGRVRCRLC